jgi:hypothetical protein
MPHFVASKISNFSWPVTLVPVRSDQRPTVLADFGKEGFVGCSHIWRYVLLVDAMSNVGSAELIENFRTVPILIEVEGEIRQPFLGWSARAPTQSLL